ncbi:hypothetical protein FB45DRAFT_262131 [Roridomyces roridus]|uniref:Secreted protein n=1 Tax=Roridomyces roridus TaxID=1738132 RepID=A0AAD7B8Z2_9AGAR|nr:hypothetical protein FB45DRAFT_262131 [Roridomyces roridus]
MAWLSVCIMPAGVLPPAATRALPCIGAARPPPIPETSKDERRMTLGFFRCPYITSARMCWNLNLVRITRCSLLRSGEDHGPMVRQEM